MQSRMRCSSVLGACCGGTSALRGTPRRQLLRGGEEPCQPQRACGPVQMSEEGRLTGPVSIPSDHRCVSGSAARFSKTGALAPSGSTPERPEQPHPSARYPVRACCTADSTFLSGGNLTQPFCATIWSPTQTVNSPRSPSTNSGCIPNSCLINSATRAALGGYDAHTLQNRMRIGCIARLLYPEAWTDYSGQKN